jgi:predicted RNA binding protein YcfA (HicA-like mRNA interferase family)
MKSLHNVSSDELIKSLKILGYNATRQTGSHIRLTTALNGEHHITIPNHNPLKIGTIAAILTDVATHHKISKAELIEKIF